LQTHPRIGITLGDPGGIGPEVLLKALVRDTSGEIRVFGSGRVLDYHARLLNLAIPTDRFRQIDIDNVATPYIGAKPEESGKATIEYLEEAFRALRKDEIDCLVTGPIQKEAWHRAGYHYAGQTEFCAAQAGVKDYCMLMAGAHFRIALLSTHLSLTDALQRIRRDTVSERIRLIDREFRKLGFPHPRIACAALNPHAGESGAFGSEEQKEIEPAVRELRESGILVDGPIAPEVVFRVAASQDKWDVILALFHDQAMIPLKLLDFETSANVTLGLPFIRTSPDHGTAFDIAGKGIANPGSMIYAIDLATDWTRKRWEAGS